MISTTGFLSLPQNDLRGSLATCLIWSFSSSYIQSSYWLLTRVTCNYILTEHHCCWLLPHRYYHSEHNHLECWNLFTPALAQNISHNSLCNWYSTVQHLCCKASIIRGEVFCLHSCLSFLYCPHSLGNSMRKAVSKDCFLELHRQWCRLRFYDLDCYDRPSLCYVCCSWLVNHLW